MTPTKVRALESIGIGLMVLALYLAAILVIMLISLARGETISTVAITAIGAVTAAAVSLALRRYTRRLRKDM
jgi:small-conductance mechanosensitive channel